MDNKMKFEVGDTVRVFTVEEVEAFVEAGGDDYSLLKCEEEYGNTAFGKIRKIDYIYKNDGSVELECEKGEVDYFYPEEILELVEKVSKMKNEKEETYSNVQINTHEDAIEALRQLLILIGENPDREGLVETPKRILKAWFEIFAGYDEDPKELIKTFTEGSCDDMVILKDIEYYSCCEHHMLPFYGKAHIAYIPNGKVIGVSKLARLLDVYARRMQIQERIGDQVTNLLMEELGCKGAICVIEGQHHCMTSRGVRKKNAQMITSSIKGCFKESEIRNEFLQLIKG